MPYCGFYGVNEDFARILEFVFAELDCRVLEAYSKFDTELEEFHSFDDWLKHISIAENVRRHDHAYLTLCPKPLASLVKINRIDLNPSTGGVFRYNAQGWGVIQLYLVGLTPKGLRPSFTNHNSEKRAHNWAETYLDKLGTPAAWDWPLITRTSNKLNRRIRSLAISKSGSRSILAGAKAALDGGTPLLLN